MPGTNAASPRLRLVGAEDPVTRERWADARRAQHAVARENRQAATNPGLDPTDPRWVLAVRVQSQLEGSALHPDRRAGLMRTARLLGVRPFDASVIIAIVQDHARRGATAAEAQSLLSMVRPPEALNRSAYRWRWAFAVVTAAAAAVLLVRWVVGAA